MPIYYCECCKFKTKLRPNYDRHVSTQKHKKSILFWKHNENGGNTEVTQMFLNNCVCPLCSKTFSSKQSMYRHKKHYCKHRNDDLQKEETQGSLNAKENNILIPSQKIICKYCSEEFTTKQAMYRHIKYTCRQNDDEDRKASDGRFRRENRHDSLR